MLQINNEIALPQNALWRLNGVLLLANDLTRY